MKLVWNVLKSGFYITESYVGGSVWYIMKFSDNTFEKMVSHAAVRDGRVLHQVRD